MSDGFLHRYILNNSSKALNKWMHYLDIYERHFERFRGKSPVLLEIGVAGGGSMEMWKGYFGEGVKILGLDINPDCRKHADKDVEILIGSQSDPAVLRTIIGKYPHIDIIIDDGGHHSPDMIASFQGLYNHVQPNGVYLVEDTHTNYWKDWAGGVKSPGSFMEFAKDKVDEINAAHTRGALTVSQFTRSIHYIAVYDSIVVFEKRPQGMRQAVSTMGL